MNQHPLHPHFQWKRLEEKQQQLEEAVDPYLAEPSVSVLTFLVLSSFVAALTVAVVDADDELHCPFPQHQHHHLLLHLLPFLPFEEEEHDLEVEMPLKEEDQDFDQLLGEHQLLGVRNEVKRQMKVEQLG